jgi:lipopolysaccharide transport system ATP-binding protein
MHSVIEVRKLSKRYAIGAKVVHLTLREEIMKAISSPFKRTAVRPEENAIWALDDVSFEVAEGDILGIIGRNGAGKSTLLKILSRITEPTSGKVTMRGRVASLLEVGTGFHPELTGRENIFLNGALLGMSRAEIKRKFDEIVAFSEIEKFLDTPVKRYSSGMYVRLAFAVAAHLEPEILIVDEVLAVGDAAFQRKCLGKMGDVAKVGRTVLFVSHNMGAVKRLCTRAMWISQGKISERGNPSFVIDKYLFEGIEKSTGIEVFSGGPHHDVQFLKVEMGGKEGLTSVFRADEPMSFKVQYQIKRKMQGVSIALNILNSDLESLWSQGDWETHSELIENRDLGFWVGEWVVPPHILRPGKYFVALGAGDGTKFYHHPEPFPIEISKEGAWRPAYKTFGIIGGPLCVKMDVKMPVQVEAAVND